MSPRNSEQVDLEAVRELSARLSYDFADPELLQLARCHRSWAAEHGGASNERLEYLGDAVLDLAIADFTYRSFPELDEGVLTTIRKGVVSTASLARCAESLDLGNWMHLGKGEELSGGRTKPALLADMFEAILGAVYLDGGLSAAQEFVERHLEATVASELAAPGMGDAKTVLQETLVREGLDAPEYEVSGSGPDHERIFAAVVSVGGSELGRGTGRSKKAAEQAAARAALEERSNA